MAKYFIKIERKEKKNKAFKTVDFQDYTEVSKQYYLNVVDKNAIRFFKSLGGTEVVKKAHTCIGLVPVEIISTSPDRTMRTIRTFKIERD